MTKYSDKNCLILGIGNGGGNAVAYIAKQIADKEEFAKLNLAVIGTDAHSLKCLEVPTKVQFGDDNEPTISLPENRKALAETHQDDIRSLLSGYDTLFVVATLGGGTGTGITPTVVNVAKEMGIWTVAVVTTPFKFEGAKRQATAQAGVDELLANMANGVNGVFVVSNDEVLKHNRELSLDLDNAFAKVDETIWQAVQGILEDN